MSHRSRSVTITVLSALLVTSCSGPNLRPDFQPKKPVFRREWSFSSRVRETRAGERGVEFSNPVLWENSLLFGSSEVGLIALYPALGGQLRWTLPIRGGVISELNLEGGRVYFGGADGFVYSVDAETGRVLWRFEVRNPKISKPRFHAGKLYFSTSDDSIYALDSHSGNLIWNYKRKTAGGASIHGASEPWVDGNQVLVGTTDGFLVALSTQEGRLLSEKKLTSNLKFTDVDAGVTQDGQQLFVPSYDGSLYALKRGSQEIVWKYDSGGTRSVTIEGENLVLASTDGHIHFLQKSSAKVLWKFRLDGGTPTHAILTPKYVIVGSSYQFIYALNRQTGELLDRWNVGYGSGFAGGLAYDSSQNLLYAVSGGANLYSFKIR